MRFLEVYFENALAKAALCGIINIKTNKEIRMKINQYNANNAPQRYDFVNSFAPEPLNFHLYNNICAPTHSQNSFEIFIILRGKVSYVSQKDSVVLREGSVCLTPPLEEHELTSPDGESLSFNLTFPTELFFESASSISQGFYSAACSGSKFYRLKPCELGYFKFLIDKMLISNEENSLVLAKTLLVNLLTALFSEGNSKEDSPEWFEDFCEKIKSPEYFLLPISNLYQLVPYSQPILNSTFKKYMGETLISYLTKLRTSYAASLLAYSSYSILEISEMASYNSLSHFTHTFKRYMGRTPSEYRRMHGKAKYLD